jgi:hypothetical protein
MSKCWRSWNGHRSTRRSGTGIGKIEASIKAAELLAKRGVIEVWTETGLYRLKPHKWPGRA